MNTRWHSLLFLLPVFMLAGVAVWVVGLERERAEVAVRAELVALAGREAERWENEAFSFFGKMPPDFVARIPAECFDAGWCPELNIPDAEQLAQWADLSGKLQQAREAKDAMADSQNSEAGVGILREMLKHPAIGDARSAAGLPMLQIVLRNLLDADRSADRMAVAIQLAAEAFKEPTPISGRLIEDAADAIFGGFPQSMRVLWTKKRGILEMLADGDEVIEHGCRFPSPRLDWDGTHRSTSSGVGRWSKEFPWIEIGSIWWFADFSLNDGFASIVSLDEVESEIFRRRNQVLRELPDRGAIAVSVERSHCQGSIAVSAGQRVGLCKERRSRGFRVSRAGRKLAAANQRSGARDGEKGRGGVGDRELCTAGRVAGLPEAHEARCPSG